MLNGVDDHHGSALVGGKPIPDLGSRQGSVQTRLSERRVCHVHGTPLTTITPRKLLLKTPGVQR